MSQQTLQQEWSYQFSSRESTDRAAVAHLSTPAPGARPRPRERRPSASSRVLLVAAGLTVSLLVLGLAFVAVNAQATKAEYMRQDLASRVAALRTQNATLACEVSRAKELSRVSALAVAAGMRRADPAADRDFLTLAAVPDRAQTTHAGWFSRGPLLAVAMTRQLNLSRVPSRAEAAVVDAAIGDSVRR